MATIVIKTKNKRAIPFLKKLFLNLKDIESFEIFSDSTTNIHESVEQGIYDVKEILTGKKKGITIRELLEDD